MNNGVASVQRMFRAIESGDFKDAADYVSAAYFNRESIDDGRSTKRGPDEFRQTIGWLRDSFSNLRFEDFEVIACADRVVVVTYMCGIQTARFMEIAPTNRNFRQRQVHIFRLDSESKVCEHLAVRDDLGLRRQLVS